jgi:hypothetical protein
LHQSGNAACACSAAADSGDDHFDVEHADQQALPIGQTPSDHVFQRSAVGRPDVSHISSDCFHVRILA